LSVNHKNQQLQSAFVIIEEKNKKGEKRGKTGKKREKNRKTGKKRKETEEANRSSSHPFILQSSQQKCHVKVNCQQPERVL